MRGLRLLVAVILAAGAVAALAQSPAKGDVIGVYAAGSLRVALTDLARAFEAQSPQRVQFTFGASGLLKTRIESGEAANVFASANMTHPESLRASGAATKVVAFARNSLCLLASPTFSLQNGTVATRLLDSGVRVGISTPGADPAGDYAFRMFEQIESSGQGPAGSAVALKSKALQLTGGPQSPPPPAGRSVYGALMEEGRADAFITYCTNAAQARREVASLQVLEVPDAINVWAQYGIASLRPSTEAAETFIAFVLGASGQSILRGHGFSPP